MNKNRLDYEMKERGVSVEALCAAVKISRSAYYRKCNGKTEFTLAEMRAIIKFLSLEPHVSNAIFFADKVS